VRLIDAPRCPFCARARLVLAEKAVDYETVEIDLGNRPEWVYALNPSGKVPILDGDLTLPESAVIMEYLEECFPTPALLPAEPAARAQARLAVFRFDDQLGDDYYAFRRGDPNDLERRLAELPVGESLFVDLAYVPWVIRLRELYDAALPERVSSWLDALLERPSVARELEVVKGFT
jgi:hypothetical protein